MSYKSIQKGFALPSVLIVSLVMFVVLIVAVQSVAASRSALTTQYYVGLANSASESGVVAAMECLITAKYVVTWSSSKPLTPATDCDGNVITGASPYVLQESGVRTSYSVSPPVMDAGIFTIHSSGTTELTQTSNGQVWRAYGARGIITAALPVMHSIDGGFVFSVGLSEDRSTIFTWGNGEEGQLGSGNIGSERIPTPAITREQLGNEYIEQVSAGGRHALALTQSGQVWAWGYNHRGQLGDGSTTNRTTPVRVDVSGTPMAGKKITYIGAGSRHSLAVDDQGGIYAWGDNQYGQIGDDTNTHRHKPVAVTTSGVLNGKRMRVADSSSNSTSSIAISDDGMLYSWGRNANGRLGDGTTADRRIPVRVNIDNLQNSAATNSVLDAATTTGNIFILMSDGVIGAAGQNTQGQLATGTHGGGNRTIPVQISKTGTPLAGKTITNITGDGHHAAVLTNDGVVYSWGWNHVGQVGVGVLGPDLCATLSGYSEATRPCSTSIRQVNSNGTSMQGRTIRQIAAGDQWTYAVATDGTAYAWGNNGHGRLGVGRYEPHFTAPVQMMFRPRILNY